MKDHNQLKDRLGESLLQARLSKQTRHEARETHQGEGIFKLERFRHISIDRWAERMLRLCLLWVLGNHDFIQKVERLESYGMRILLNESTPLERGGEKLWIAGVDDPHFYQTHDFADARHGIPADACSVLLCHSPEPHAEASRYGFGLMLSGHTHGGQICLPGGRHLVSSSKGLHPQFIKGRWESGGMLGYTSPGTGSSGVAARLNCPPEITLHVLRSTAD